jgi:hypothetical protein
MDGWMVVQCWGEGNTLPVGLFASRQEAQEYAWAARSCFRLVEFRSGKPVPADAEAVYLAAHR